MTVIDEFLNDVPAPQRAELERIRKIAHTTAPDLEETIGYGMPVLKYKGTYVLGFAVFKDHMSIFPGGAATTALKDELTDYKTSKGTIQFTLEHPLPEHLIQAVIRLRLDTITT